MKRTPQPRWRVGRKVGRTIYCDDVLVGVMDTPELATFIVGCANLCVSYFCAASRLDRKAAASKKPRWGRG